LLLHEGFPWNILSKSSCQFISNEFLMLRKNFQGSI